MTRREKLQTMLQKEPDDVFLNYALAMELVKESAVDALAQLDRVLGLDPSYVGAYQQKAQLLISAGRLAEARACIRQGIAVAETSGNQHAADELRGLLDSIA